MKAPIGVFDSGVGGLTVLAALSRRLPREKFIYVGDTAHVPYGTKSPESIKRFALEIISFLTFMKVKSIVVACNTVSAVALADLIKLRHLPIQGVIDPGAQAAVSATRTGRVGVIGTQATIHSGAYEKALHRLSPKLKVFSAACPLFVPLVEEGWEDQQVTRRIARHYLTPLLEKKIDTLVLGCTHYPLLKPVLSWVARDVTLIDSAEETAKVVETRLGVERLLADRGRGNVSYYASDDPEKFSRLGGAFFGRPLTGVRRVNLDEV